MADINIPSLGPKQRGTRAKRLSTRVDLTPMVDLGFILITFFLFTTTLSEKKVMDIAAPNDNDKTIRDEICASCVVTFVLAGNNNVFYYEGLPEGARYLPTNYGTDGVRSILLEKRQKLLQRLQKDELIVIIKPSAESNFKNLIDVIDECTITHAKRYYMDEITKEEQAKLDLLL